MKISVLYLLYTITISNWLKISFFGKCIYISPLYARKKKHNQAGISSCWTCEFTKKKLGIHNERNEIEKFIFLPQRQFSHCNSRAQGGVRLGDKAGSARGKRRQGALHAEKHFQALSSSSSSPGYNHPRSVQTTMHTGKQIQQKVCSARVEHLRPAYGRTAERENSCNLTGIWEFLPRKARREIEGARGKWKTEARANIGTRRGFQIAAPEHKKRRRMKKRDAGAGCIVALRLMGGAQLDLLSRQRGVQLRRNLDARISHDPPAPILSCRWQPGVKYLSR